MSQAKYHLRIQPKKSLLDVDLKELWKYRDMIALFIRRDFVSLYKQTILGPTWFIIQPVLSTLMYTVVFAGIAKIPTAGLPPVLFYMSGTVIWSYFSTCLLKTSDTFITNASIFGKVYFPRLAVPISITISSLVQFIIQLVLFLGFMIYYIFQGYHFNIGFSVLLIPLLLVILACLGLGFGIIVSSMTTKYRDLKQLLSFGVQLWMYASPVIIPLTSVPNKYKIVFLLNPLTGIIEAFKSILLNVGEIHYLYLSYDFGFMLVILTIGILLFNRIEQNFMDHV